MRRFFIILLAFSCVIMVNGCAKKQPRDVVKIWASAIANGDLKTADKYSTGAVHPYNNLLIAGVKDKNHGTPPKMDDILQKIESSKEEINGDTAKIYVDETNPILLKKVNGKWKVDLTK